MLLPVFTQWIVAHYTDDEEITHRPEHRRACYLGRVFQDPAAGTAANMTIEENLSLAITKGTQRGLRRGLHQRQRKLFQEKLRVLDLGLENRLNDKVGLLSGGQRQALSLLMAVLVKPKLLLLDEHTAALDPKTATHILKLTEELIKQSNLTALMVTHNLEQALRVGSRTIMMHEGQIILDISGPKRTVMKVPDLLEQFNKVRGTDFVDDRALLA